VRIEYDRKTGKETATSQIESAVWRDNAFVVTETFKQEAKPYKIIVGYKNTDEFSEDWGFFMNDVSEELSDYQVTVVPNEGDKVIIDNPDLSLEIDLKPILAKSKIDGWCYILIENGKQPKIIDYDTPDVTVSLAKEYFNLK